MAERTKVEKVELEFGNRRFTFDLCSRELDFGSAGHGTYFWMDSRQFRTKNPGPNYRACIDHWWTAVEAAGVAGDLSELTSRVLAECYPLISTARSLQEIYADAQLNKLADRQLTLVNEGGRQRTLLERAYTLPPDEVERIRRVAMTRKVECIREELEALFLGELPTAKEMPAFQEAARNWI